MDKTRDFYQKVYEDLQQEFGGKLYVTRKEGWLWFPFQGNYGITLLRTIGLPDNWDTRSYAAKAALLMHEAEHVRQQERLGFGNIYLGFFLFLVIYFFLPFPVVFSYGRAKLEMAGYKETLRGYYLAYGKGRFDLEYLRGSILEQFTGRRYFWMWPFKRYMNRWFDRTVKEIQNEEGINASEDS